MERKEAIRSAYRLTGESSFYDGMITCSKATAANVHDVTETSKLLTGDENEVYGGSGYLGAEKREDAVVENKSGRKIRYKINLRPSQIKKLSKEE